MNIDGLTSANPILGFVLVSVIILLLVSSFLSLSPKANKAKLKQAIAQFFLLPPYWAGLIIGAIIAIISLTVQSFGLGYDKAHAKLNGQNYDNTSTDTE